MLPLTQKIIFLVFALITGSIAVRGFHRLYRRIARGREDTDERTDQLLRRLWYALVTTLTQSRTFRKRPMISFFHSLIFYGFVFYLLVNLVDAVDGFVPLSITSVGLPGQVYILLADLLSACVLLGVIALVLRRFLLPSRRDFSFNERTMLHKEVRQQYITRDSILVSAFILFHVGSRAIGAGAKLALEGPDRFAPFATLLSHMFTSQDAVAWRIFGYWGALGSVLAFLMYFPYSKHIHIFLAPMKYFVSRRLDSGVLPHVDLDMDAEEPKLGASKLEDFAWPRLLDAYACIQCNRCQDVCPATATGKSLSPSALEINKRMELNELSRHLPGFEAGAPSPNPLLSFALSPEAAWACTTCGACVQVCPVQDEPMLDIIDIRRQQVMVEGEFPKQLQSAFRGMERAKNPWGINHEKRMDWAAGLNVRTTDENPEPDVLFWVGCAASYDPQSQKTARAFVQLLEYAGVDFAVLGKRECCTGDSARRAGNEYLYRQLADENVTTLNEVKPKLIVATCPHCLNSVGKEYKQIGGDFKVIHHTEYLQTLVADGRLVAEAGPSTVAFHDPCYLGRHNGVYDAPRNLLNILSNAVVELPRNRENSFCCGAGGAQFWKEEEPGFERISDNRYREAQQVLDGAEEQVLAVGCPFCKSMLESTPGKGSDTIAVKDIAVLLLEGVQRRSGKGSAPEPSDVVVPMLSGTAPGSITSEDALTTRDPSTSELFDDLPAENSGAQESIAQVSLQAVTMDSPNSTKPGERKKWAPKAIAAEPLAQKLETQIPAVTAVKAEVDHTDRTSNPQPVERMEVSASEMSTVSPEGEIVAASTGERKKWSPKANAAERLSQRLETPISATTPVEPAVEGAETSSNRESVKPAEGSASEVPIVCTEAEAAAMPKAAERKKWSPKRP